MANFLTWATDVLEKVDQSAAHLSDSGTLDRNRRRRKGSSPGHVSVGGEALNDGQLSDVSGYGSDKASDRRWSEGLSLPSHQQRLQVDSIASGVPQTYLSSRSPTSYGAGGGDSLLLPATWEQPCDPTSALYAAKAPSLAMENLRAVRKAMEGKVWQQPELKREFEETLRQTSEVEAKVSILAANMDRLRKSSALAAALNAQELQNLHEEAQLAQASYGKERNSHTATRIQSQMRESSLAAENVAYAKALGATQRHAAEKASEAARLEARVQELENKKERLTEDLDELREQVAEQQEKQQQQQAPSQRSSSGVLATLASGGSGRHDLRAGEIERSEAGGTEEEWGVDGGFSAAAAAARKLHRKQAELASWDAKVAALEKELASLQQNSARWPSLGQREQDLERRLRSLNEQLLAKQGQAEALSNEKAALQQRLEKINEVRRQLQLASSDPHGAGASASGVPLMLLGELKRGSKGIVGSTSMGGAKIAPGGGQSGGSDEREPFPRTLRSRTYSNRQGRGGGGGGAGGAGEGSVRERVVRTVNALSRQAGAALQQSQVVRSLIVGYVLALHLAVFLILWVAAAQKALRS
eukprot:TRINITY_DN12776_c0_g1_i1.p1 TRINITY_DN12776_c0_g1~~TRINITY_DN12776_c0_g1_i1.p1  ORF type:complete len:587 (+),score=182.79 TRINITY_DN12776_c0_g1_i1:105-1865(+)